MEMSSPIRTFKCHGAGIGVADISHKLLFIILRIPFYRQKPARLMKRCVVSLRRIGSYNESVTCLYSSRLYSKDESASACMYETYIYVSTFFVAKWRSVTDIP